MPKNFLEIDQYKIRAFLTHPITAVFTETGLLWLAATWAKGFIACAAALTDPTGLFFMVAAGMGLLFSLAHKDLWDKNIDWLEFGNRFGQRFVAGFVFSSLLLFDSTNWAVAANIALHGFVNGGKFLNDRYQWDAPVFRQLKYLNIPESQMKELSFFKPVKVMGRSQGVKQMEQDVMADRLAKVLTRVLLNFSAQEVVNRLNRISHRKYQVQDFTGTFGRNIMPRVLKIVYRLMGKRRRHGTAQSNGWW